MKTESKRFFKAEITDGLLEAGDIIILVSKESRSSLDRELLEK